MHSREFNDLSRSTDPLLSKQIGYFGWGLPQLNSAERVAQYLDAQCDTETVDHVLQAIETVSGQGNTALAEEMLATLKERRTDH